MKYLFIILLFAACKAPYPYRNHSGWAKATLVDTSNRIHTYITVKEGAVLKFPPRKEDNDKLCIGATYSVRPSKAKP